MAEITPVPVQELAKSIEGIVYQWPNVQQGDTFKPLSVNDGSDQITIGVHGTSGGASIGLQGRLSREAGSELNVEDTQGTVIGSMGIGDAKVIGTLMTDYIPTMAGATGSTNLTVEMFVGKKTRFGL